MKRSIVNWIYRGKALFGVGRESGTKLMQILNIRYDAKIKESMLTSETTGDKLHEVCLEIVLKKVCNSS